MRIGELAALVGLSTATIRFYERTGVIAPACRAANGYRDYSDRAVADLRFVRAGQAIGLTLEELGEIVAFRDQGESPCAELVALMERRLGEVEARLEELGQIRRDLVTLVAAARGADFDDCPQPMVYAMLTTDAGMDLGAGDHG